jgi:hypothetical protein
MRIDWCCVDHHYRPRRSNNSWILVQSSRIRIRFGQMDTIERSAIVASHNKDELRDTEKGNDEILPGCGTYNIRENKMQQSLRDDRNWRVQARSTTPPGPIFSRPVPGSMDHTSNGPWHHPRQHSPIRWSSPAEGRVCRCQHTHW